MSPFRVISRSPSADILRGNSSVILMHPLVSLG
nr:MAG TPA: hypothetical protein [Caudoviricetes sp.]